MCLLNDQSSLDYATACTPAQAREALSLAVRHRRIFIPLCVKASVISASKVTQGGEERYSVRKSKTHFISHLEDWVKDCGPMGPFSAQVGERLNKSVLNGYKHIRTHPQRHILAAEVLPFLNLTPIKPTTIPCTKFIKDKFYYFIYPGHEDFYDAFRFSALCEDQKKVKGIHYTYIDGNQMEVNGVIGFYIYTEVGETEILASNIYDRFDAALAKDLGYCSIEKSALIVPVRSRK
ncbi:hypothetical protein ADUPG1_011338 [Aduncisulcus paluster]|uniref:Uncharacterized protein n=1 Tax=Aduncisulcus paluster TaxID=2918883 RepID=A0ABQ5JV86_9EUKA|nr:hypothetical protein ADUPG1_011338 [Aduncisulcus paluster]